MRLLLWASLMALGCSKQAPSGETVESLLTWVPAGPGATASVFDVPTTREAREKARRNTPSTGLADVDRKARALGLKPSRVVFVQQGLLKAAAMQVGPGGQGPLDGWTVADLEGTGLAERMIAARKGGDQAIRGVAAFVKASSAFAVPFLFAVGKDVEKGLPSDPRPAALFLRTDMPNLEVLLGYGSEADAEKAVASVKAFLSVMSPSTEPVRTGDRIRVRFAMAKDSPLVANQAKDDLRRLGEALEAYRAAKGSYPSTAEGLRALEGAVDLDALAGIVPRDPWGKEYEYRFPHPKQPVKYVLRSHGPDGESDSLDDVFAPDGPSRPEPPRKKEEPNVEAPKKPEPPPPPPPPVEQKPKELPIARKVTLEVERKTWRKKAWDVGAELKKKLREAGVEVVKKGPADARLVVRFEEEKGAEILGFENEHTTKFTFSMDVLPEGKDKPVLQLEISAEPIGEIRKPFYESSLDVFKESAQFSHLEHLVARALLVPGAGPRLLPALLDKDSRGDAADLIKSVPAADDGPAVAAALAVADEDWEAAVKIGEPAIEPLERVVQVPDILDRQQAFLALSRIPGKKAHEALLRAFNNLTMFELMDKEGRQILDLIVKVGDESSLRHLKGVADDDTDDDDIREVRRACKEAHDKLRARLK